MNYLSSIDVSNNRTRNDSTLDNLHQLTDELKREKKKKHTCTNVAFLKPFIHEVLPVDT
jgi:hypothetical protein